MPQAEIDANFIEKLKANDERWRHIETAIKLDEEIRDSLALKIVLDVVTTDAKEALEALAWVDPTDVKAIVALQARVQRDRIISNTFEAIRLAGTNAHQSLQEEGSIDMDNSEGR